MTDPHCTRRQLMTGVGATLAAGAAGLSPSASAGAQGSADPPFKLGTVTYNVPKDWDLDTLCRILPQAGVEGVELRTTHAHGVEPSLTAQERATVRQRAADGGLILWGLGSVCEFHSADPAIVRQNVATCAEFVKLAKDVGAKGVKVRPNGFPPGVSEAGTLEQIALALRECGKIGADHGVEIWLEVHGRGTQEPRNIQSILKQCDHQMVGANWNSNPTDLSSGSLSAAFELLRPYLKSVHINDLWGSYPYRELFTLLRKAGYDRYTLCEVGTPVRAEDGLLFFRCYKGLWRELARS